MDAEVLYTGEAVLPQAMRMLPQLTPVIGQTPYGAYAVPIGTIDKRAGIVILGGAEFSPNYRRTYFIQGDKLKALDTNTFVKNYLIGDTAAESYRRTAWIVPVTRTVTAFTMGLVFGYTGLGINIVVNLTRYTVIANANEKEVTVVFDHLPTALRTLFWFKKNCPTLYSKLTAVLSRGVAEALLSVPDGFTAEDVAGIAGRFLGAAMQANKVASQAGDAAGVGFKALAWIATRTLAVYTTLHLPHIAARGAVHNRENREKLADALLEELKKQTKVTPTEAQLIRQELTRSADALANLENLGKALEAVAPALDKLAVELAK